jgi:4-oxalomesaconate tautomerase
VAKGIAKIPDGRPIVMSVEHPSGEFTVQLEVEGEGANFSVGRSGILRTARALFEGYLLVPQAVWEGK